MDPQKSKKNQKKKQNRRRVAASNKKKQVVYNPPGRNVIKLSRCALLYYKALSDPFYFRDFKTDLPCYPDSTQFDTLRGVFTQEFTVQPSASSNGWIKIFPLAMMAGATVPTNDAPIASSNNASLWTVTNKWNTATSESFHYGSGPVVSVAQQGVFGRIVGAGVEYFYTGTEQNRGGALELFYSKTNRNLGAFTLAELQDLGETRLVHPLSLTGPVRQLWAPRNPNDVAFGDVAAISARDNGAVLGAFWSNNNTNLLVRVTAIIEYFYDDASGRESEADPVGLAIVANSVTAHQGQPSALARANKLEAAHDNMVSYVQTGMQYAKAAAHIAGTFASLL